jgi:hypothetical protein
VIIFLNSIIMANNTLVSVPAADQTGKILTSTNHLIAGQSLISSNNSCKLTFQSDGNLVIYVAGKPVWSSQTLNADRGAFPGSNGLPTNASENSYIVMQNDGSLVAYADYNNPGGDALYAVVNNTYNPSVYTLTLLDSNSFTIAGTFWKNQPQ